MKKTLAVLLVFLVIIVGIFSGCGDTTPAGVGTTTQALPTTSGTDTTGSTADPYALTEDVVLALQNTTFEAPKNIIYMIGDGMGLTIIEATREAYADELYNGNLSLDYLKQVCTQSTYSVSHQITDSAAGGTALSSGFKTSNDTIAMDPTHSTSYKTVLELAAEKGKSTGIVVTKSVTDATPASFSSHVSSRTLQTEIARQQLEKVADGSLDLILGGGSSFYEHGDAAEAFIAAKNAGMSYNKFWTYTKKATLPLVGLYATENNVDTKSKSIPSLAEMTEFALDRLSQDEKGFFLMVEGSQIDNYGHNNDFSGEIHEMYQFDRAIAVAMKFITQHPDTVLIITADHETGGLYLSKEGLGTRRANYLYTSSGHTSINVPVYAAGYGTEALEGIRENTDIAAFVASLMGEKNFGQKSTVRQLYSVGEKDGIANAFDSENPHWDITDKSILSGMNKVKNATAIHFTITNHGEKRVVLPKLMIVDAEDCIYGALPQYTYIDAGETLSVSYTLPIEMREDNLLHGTQMLRLSYEVNYWNTWQEHFNYQSETAQLEITEIHVTDRAPGK